VDLQYISFLPNRRFKTTLWAVTKCCCQLSLASRCNEKAKKW